MNIKLLLCGLLALSVSACAQLQTNKQSNQTVIEQPQVAELKQGVPIYFESNSSNIEQKFIDYLSVASQELAKNKSFVLLVEGHTDNRGSIASNNRISLERATTVRNILVMQYHVDPKQIVVAGYGASKPIADNATREGQALNRRVLLTLKIK